MNLEMELTSTHLQNQLRLDAGGTRDGSGDGVDPKSAQIVQTGSWTCG